MSKKYMAVMTCFFLAGCLGRQKYDYNDRGSQTKGLQEELQKKAQKAKGIDESEKFAGGKTPFVALDLVYDDQAENFDMLDANNPELPLDPANSCLKHFQLDADNRAVALRAGVKEQVSRLAADLNKIWADDFGPKVYAGIKTFYDQNPQLGSSDSVFSAIQSLGKVQGRLSLCAYSRSTPFTLMITAFNTGDIVQLSEGSRDYNETLYVLFHETLHLVLNDSLYPGAEAAPSLTAGGFQSLIDGIDGNERIEDWNGRSVSLAEFFEGLEGDTGIIERHIHLMALHQGVYETLDLEVFRLNNPMYLASWAIVDYNKMQLLQEIGSTWEVVSPVDFR